MCAKHFSYFPNFTLLFKDFCSKDLKSTIKKWKTFLLVYHVYMGLEQINTFYKIRPILTIK
jgi:hypothetical protein